MLRSRPADGDDDAPSAKRPRRAEQPAPLAVLFVPGLYVRQTGCDLELLFEVQFRTAFRREYYACAPDEHDELLDN